MTARVTERRAALLAWSACGLTVAFSAATAAFGLLNDGTALPPREGGGEVGAAGDLTFTVMIVAFSALGALVASRRPRNPIGWILCISPLALGFTGVTRGWYIHTFFADPGSLPPADLLYWAANWAWIPGFIPLITLLLLLFPEGHLVSRRWRAVTWLTGAAMGLLVLGYAFAPGPLEDYPQAENPLGVRGPISSALEAFQYVGFPLFTLATVASLASLVVRFRRARGVERQQLKWMAAAAALVVAAWMLNSALDQGFGINSAFLMPVALLALPIAATVAVLRHRLYDAARTLEAFSARLRDEVDLDALGEELRAVVREAMQPMHVSLRLRGPPR